MIGVYCGVRLNRPPENLLHQLGAAQYPIGGVMIYAMLNSMT